jgi:uncharacterized protein (DUF1778 family)
MANETRGARLSLTMSASDKAAIKKASEVLGVSMSEFARRALLDAAARQRQLAAIDALADLALDEHPDR